MKIYRQKLFFETTKEIEETKENWKKLKNKVSNVSKKLKNKILNPKDTAKDIKEGVVNKYNKYKNNPSLIKSESKELGKKAVKFVKENPRDALYLAGGYAIPAAIAKYTKSKKGKAIAGIAALLPLGESAVAIDHFSRSKEGKTAFKAGKQVISGTYKDIKNKFKKNDNT